MCGLKPAPTSETKATTKTNTEILRSAQDDTLKKLIKSEKSIAVVAVDGDLLVDAEDEGVGAGGVVGVGEAFV